MLPPELLRLCCTSSRLVHANTKHAARSSSRRRFGSSCQLWSSTKPYLVTTPIFYVNANPHLGHLHSMVLADVFHRYNSLKTGQQGVFCTGTDEHGLKIQKVAEAAGEMPGQLCDRVSQTFRDLTGLANIACTRFIRTTEPQHVEAVRHLWTILVNKGFIYKGKHEGWYSVSDEAFYSPSQVSDEHDPVTGASYKIATETGNRVEWSQEENYMFRLSLFRDRLLDWLEADETTLMPATRYLEVVRQLQNEPLSDLSVSRPRSRLKWGVAVPNDEDHTIYVWLDALTNYLTVAGWPHASTQTAWPADLHVIGKDIIRFHIIYWPAFLMAADLPLPKTVLAHAHWTMDHFKMSKSRGNVVDPVMSMKLFGADAMRYYLMRIGGSLTTDTNFSLEHLQDVYRKDLAGQLGNLLSRISSPKVMGRLHSPDAVFTRPSEHSRSRTLDELFENLPGRVEWSMAKFQPSRALKFVFDLINETNQHLAAVEPWRTVCSDEDAHAAIFYSAEALRFASWFLWPVMPSVAERLQQELGLLDASSVGEMKLGALQGETIPESQGKRAPLFPKVELKSIQ